MRFLLNENCLGFFLAWNPFRYPVDIDAVTTTFRILVNTYFLNFRLALLIVLRALVHLIYLVTFQCLTFLFLISNNNLFFSGYLCILLIFDVVPHYQPNVFKIPEMIPKISHDFGQRCKVHSLSSHLSYFPELFILSVKPFINSLQSYLFCNKCWLSYFLAIE